VHLATPLGVIPSEFRRGHLRDKTRVPGLWCGVVFEILRLAVFDTIPDCDGQTHRQTDGRARDDVQLIPR